MYVYLILFVLLVILSILYMRRRPIIEGMTTPHRVLWCEYPEYSTNIDDYFKTLNDFIKRRNITRLIFRFQDPANFEMYAYPDDTESICSKPSNKYPNILDDTEEGQKQRDQCCFDNCGGDYGDTGVWCEMSSKTSGTCSGKCNKKLKCGQAEQLRGKFFEFMRSLNIELYLVPWIRDNIGFPNPPDTLDTITETEWNMLSNIERSIKWIEMANRYVSDKITGVVFEPEGSGFSTPDALQQFDNALRKYIKGYRPVDSTTFKLTATIYSFSNLPVYVHEIYPEMYNLTRNTDPIEVDATSDDTLLRKGNYTPKFPETAYTLCKKDKTPADCMLDKMKQFHKTFTERSENVFPMFSTEIAPSELAGISNPYNKQPTITGTTNTGTINAFSLWEWNDFNDFLNKIISEYKVGGVAIFQMNMISKDW
jgi:hypothetical protein